MSRMKGVIVVNTDRYKGRSLCVVACPQKVVEPAQKQVNTYGYRHAQAVNPDGCVSCAARSIVCPDGCIAVYGERVEA